MKYYLDTEFNGMDGDLISLALVSEDGREIYLSTPCRNPVPWVAENVIPIIDCDGATSIRTGLMGIRIGLFLMEDKNPIIIADWPDDISYFCKTLILRPGQMVTIRAITFKMVRVDAYPTDLPGAVQHNALWDARALRHKLTATA